MGERGMENNIDKIFQTTIAGLEDGLQVQHIATFSIVTCSLNDPVNHVLDAHPGYDRVPVKDEKGCIVAVLERTNGELSEIVKDCMKPLDDSVLVSAEEPLNKFIPSMADEPHYRLVLRGMKIDGIVTRSDLLKLPVRLLVFARVTHLEMLIARIIQANCMNYDDWLRHLSQKEQDDIKKGHGELERSRDDPPLLELTQLGQKIRILRKILSLDDNTCSRLEEVRHLRNSIAHAKDFAGNEERLCKFMKHLEFADGLIQQMYTHLSL